MKQTVRIALLAATLLSTSPALADHTGPGSGISTGGGINTVSAGTMDEGHIATAVRWSIARPDQLSDGELLSRDASGIDAHSARYVSSASVGVAYGVTHELTLSADLPYIRRADIRAIEEGAPINRGTSAGIGDLTLLAKYKFLHGETWALAILGGAKLPTGSTHQRDAAGQRFETEHQPGTGSLDPIAGIAASIGFGTTALDTSWVYQTASNGAQATRLGDRSQAGIALSHRFGHAEPVPHHHDTAHEQHQNDHNDDHDAPRATAFDAIVELNGEWEGRETVAGVVDANSGARVLWLSPGARFSSKAGWSIIGSVGLAVAQRVRPSHPDNHYRFALSVGRSF